MAGVGTLALLGLTTVAAAAGGGFDGDASTTERIDHATGTAAAIEISRALWDPDGATHAVLSRDDRFPDALAGTALLSGGPLLFTATNSLTPATRAEIDRVLAPGGVVYVLGGTSAIAESVAQALRDAGYTVRRLAGADRIATAIAVADEVLRLGTSSGDAFLARSNGPTPSAEWADAVTVGARAAFTRTPVLLTPTSHLDSRVQQWLQSNAGGTRILLGGTSALSTAVENATPTPRRRVAGADRHETAAQIARQLWGENGTGTRRFTILNAARDDGWPFGLPAAAFGGRGTPAPMLTVAPSVAPSATLSLASSSGGPQVDLLVLGTSTQVHPTVVSQLDAADGGNSGGSDGGTGGGTVGSTDLDCRWSDDEGGEYRCTGRTGTSTAASFDCADYDWFDDGNQRQQSFVGCQGEIVAGEGAVQWHCEREVSGGFFSEFSHGDAVCSLPANGISSSGARITCVHSDQEESCRGDMDKHRPGEESFTCFTYHQEPATEPPYCLGDFDGDGDQERFELTYLAGSQSRSDQRLQGAFGRVAPYVYAMLNTLDWGGVNQR